MLLPWQQVDEYGLVDLRCSPIPSLRRSYQNHVTSHGHPPRMPTTVHVIGCPPIRDYVAQSTLRRRKVASSALRNKRVLSSVREKAKALRQKLPVVTDVNRIDKYSRLVFPTLFIVFNLLYWYHYSVGRHTNWLWLKVAILCVIIIIIIIIVTVIVFSHYYIVALFSA